VTVAPGETHNVGLGSTADGASNGDPPDTTLHIKPQSGYLIKDSQFVPEGAGGLWTLDSESENEHTYKLDIGTTDGDVSVHINGDLKPDGSGGGGGDPLEPFDVKVANVDLDADTDNTGSISGKNSEDEAEDEDPGVIVPLNGGTDEGNTDGSGEPVPDYEKDSDDGYRIVTGDDQLRDAQLSVDTKEESGTLSWSVPSGIKVWRTDGSGELEEIQDGDKEADFSGGDISLRLEGVSAGGGSVLAEFTPTSGSKQEGKAKDKIDLTVAALDLTIQGLGDESGPTPHEQNPGAMIVLNNDDDDGDNNPDNSSSQSLPVSNEDDLAAANIEFLPTNLDQGEVTLEIVAGTSKVDLWLNSDKDIKLGAGADTGSGAGAGTAGKSATWDLSAVNPPSTVYVEGISASDNARDVELKLSLKVDGVTQSDTNIRGTVVTATYTNVWNRNLEPLDNGDFPKYKKTRAWEFESDPNNNIDFKNYLKITPNDISFEDISDYAKFDIAKTVWGSASIVDDTKLEYENDDPGDTNIYGFGVELKWQASVLDRVIIVVFSLATSTNYTDWVSDNSTSPSWLSELPPVYSELGSGDSDPEPSGCSEDEWEDWGGEAESLSNNYHYDAAHEMRSHETSGGHGHQATYDQNGALISATPSSPPEQAAAAGTADRSHPDNVFELPGRNTHFEMDVAPFVRAAQLDGNPVDSSLSGAELSQPLIRVGPELRKYYDRRPPHTGDQVAAGNCAAN